MTRTRRTSVAAAAVLLALTVAGCGRESDGDVAEDPAPSSATGTTDPADTGEADLPSWTPAIVTDGDAVTGFDFTGTPEPGPALEVATVRQGDGPEVKEGDSITVHYYGSLYGSETPFDESYSGGQPATFDIGVGGVIPGWDQGIPGIAVGSRIIMSIPADLGYGATGFPPVIPPDSPLYFVVDIISVDDGT